MGIPTVENNAGEGAGEAAGREREALIRLPERVLREAVELVQAMDEPGRAWEALGKRERVDRARAMIRSVLTLQGPENGGA